MKSVKILLLCGLALAAPFFFVHAQTATDTTGQPIMTDPNEDVSNLSDLEVELKALELAAPLAASNAPAGGNFYSAQHAPGSAEEWPPLPGNIFNLPVWPLDTNIFVLDDLNFNYGGVSTKAPKMSSVKSSGLLVRDNVDPDPYDAGGGNTNSSYTPEDYPNVLPDYGTNLWIAQWGMVSNTLSAIASNTVADVEYEIQTNSNLTTTNWAGTGQFILGSEVTNWTQFILPPPPSTNNLFFRLQSWVSSDDTGLPNWWEAKYFGTNAVDPYADPTGDGYTILEDFQNGWNPNQFRTPAAPQGLTLQMDSTGSNVLLSWQACSGNVSGYIVEAIYGGDVDNPSILGTNTASQTTLSANLGLAFFGTIDLAPGFRVIAQYSNGASSAPSEIVNLETQYAQPLQIIPNADGQPELAVGPLPPDAVSILFSSLNGGPTYTVAVSNLVNGFYALPNAFVTPNLGSLFAETLQSDGQFDFDENLNVQGLQPFYDGRKQMKENLIFQMRAAVTAPLHFDIPSTNDDVGTFGAYVGDYNYTAGYAYASLYQFANIDSVGTYGVPDPFLPFEENCLFANFVFNLSNVGDFGGLATGTIIGGGSVTLSRPLAYQFQTNGMALPDLLATNVSRWVYTDNEDPTWVYDSGLASYNTDDNTITMTNGFLNWFGLPYVSTELAWGNSSGDTFTLNAGHSSSDSEYDSVFLYPEAAQPQFQAVEYDFWNANWRYNAALDANVPPIIPGNTNFSPANAIPVIIAPVGSQIQIAGYAKLEATKSAYSGVYGYLGQYFTNAFEINTNGDVTTNQTGVLSPYGSFFPTRPGPIALTTMGDPDTGQQGTCTVYCVSMNVDKNHDGTMDLSFNGPDTTSQITPMRFWVNSDNDWSYFTGDPGQDANTTIENADYTYQNIPSQRDLEDWSRLWICGMPALTNGYEVTLSWNNVSSGSPAVNLVKSVESDGGVGYLTNTDVAIEQTTGSTSSDPSYKFARITTGQSYAFPGNYFNTSTNHYFLFEGAGIGTGELTLTVTDNQGNIIGQTGVWLDLHDIKDFYEMALATNVTSGLPPSTLISQFKPLRIVPAAPDESQQIIIFVHGINNTAFDAQTTTETMYKRLYWSGYHGRVAEFKWPCAFLPFDNTLNPFDFNLGEFYAWKSATALKYYLNYLRSRPDLSGYQINIFAHSQGNIVASEAVKLGASFDNYILTQGAAPAHCYDTSVPTLQELVNADAGTPTPYSTTNGGYNGYFTNLTGNLINFYNTNDYALVSGTWFGLQANWVADQASRKPENFTYRFGQDYEYHPSTGQSFAYYDLSQYTVTDPDEIMSMVARSRTNPVGAQSGVGGVMNTNASVDLVGSFDFGNIRAEHSAEFTRPIQTAWPYYDQVLTSLRIQHITR